MTGLELFFYVALPLLVLLLGAVATFEPFQTRQVAPHVNAGSNSAARENVGDATMGNPRNRPAEEPNTSPTRPVPITDSFAISAAAFANAARDNSPVTEIDHSAAADPDDPVAEILKRYYEGTSREVRQSGKRFYLVTLPTGQSVYVLGQRARALRMRMGRGRRLTIEIPQENPVSPEDNFTN
ncbi:hypothetical protein [Rhizobium leguminosarum]|uniref:hypothetical protein n=1 Tax=Rhizobium leguminosarum TaxID=384 RepID=UPI003F972881